MLETVIVSDILNSFFNVLYFFNALFVISKTWLKWWRDVTTQQGLKYSFEMKYSFVCVNSSTYSCIVIVSLGGKASANVSRMEMTWDFTIMIFYRNRIWKMLLQCFCIFASWIFFCIYSKIQLKDIEKFKRKPFVSVGVIPWLVGLPVCTLYFVLS